MKKINFIGQASILMLAGIFVRLMGFLYRIPLTNMLGDEGIGYYSAAFQIYIFFFILSSSAVPNALSKIISAKIGANDNVGAERIFRVALKFTIITGFLAGVTMFIFSGQLASVIGNDGARYGLVVLAPTIFIVGIMGVLRGYFQGRQNMVPTATSQVVEQIFNAIFSVLMAYILLGKGLEYGVAGGTLGTFFGAISGLIVLIILYIAKRDKNLKYKKGNELETFKELLNVIVPMIVGSTVFTMTTLVDVVVLKPLLLSSGMNETIAAELYGQYTGKFVVFMNFPAAIITSLAVAIVPNISANFAAKKYNLIKIKLEKLLKLGIIFIVPCIVVLATLAKSFLKIIFPYAPNGEDLFTYGAYMLMFVVIMKITTAVLQGTGNFWTPVKGGMVAMVVKILAVVLLVPKVGIYGSIISAYISYAVYSIFNLYMVKSKIKTNVNVLKIMIKPVFAGIIMYITSVKLFEYTFEGGYIQAFLITAITSAVVYLIVLITTKGLTKDDLKIR